jgi:hypothetical protein
MRGIPGAQCAAFPPPGLQAHYMGSHWHPTLKSITYSHLRATPITGLDYQLPMMVLLKLDFALKIIKIFILQYKSDHMGGGGLQPSAIFYFF